MEFECDDPICVRALSFIFNVFTLVRERNESYMKEWLQHPHLTVLSVINFFSRCSVAVVPRCFYFLVQLWMILSPALGLLGSHCLSYSQKIKSGN